jgi:hypothetical protein
LSLCSRPAPGVATILLLFPLVALAIIAAVAMTIRRGTRRVRPLVLELMSDRFDPQCWEWRRVRGIRVIDKG